MTGEIGGEETVDGVGDRGGGGREFGLSAFEISVGFASEGNGRVPFQALIDPGAEGSDLIGGQAGALFGHDEIGVEAGDEVDEVGIATIAWDDGGAGVGGLEERIAIVDAEAAFGFSPGVAFGATGIEDGLDIAGKVDGSGRRRGELGELVWTEFGVGLAEKCGDGEGEGHDTESLHGGHGRIYRRKRGGVPRKRLGGIEGEIADADEERYGG